MTHYTRIDSVEDAENANLFVLPGECWVEAPHARCNQIQPDVIIDGRNSFILIEAKGIKSGAFLRHQLAREFLFLLGKSGERNPFLLAITAKPPPFSIPKLGKLTIKEAIEKGLPNELDAGIDASPFVERINESVGWLTWTEVKEIVSTQAKSFRCDCGSTERAVRRLSLQIVSSIEWHSEDFKNVD